MHTLLKHKIFESVCAMSAKVIVKWIIFSFVSAILRIVKLKTVGKLHELVLTHSTSINLLFEEFKNALWPSFRNWVLSNALNLNCQRSFFGQFWTTFSSYLHGLWGRFFRQEGWWCTTVVIFFFSFLEVFFVFFFFFPPTVSFFLPGHCLFSFLLMLTKSFWHSKQLIVSWIDKVSIWLFRTAKKKLNM